MIKIQNYVIYPEFFLNCIEFLAIAISKKFIYALLIRSRSDRRQIATLELQFDRFCCCAVTFLIRIEEFFPGAELIIVHDVVTAL